MGAADPLLYVFMPYTPSDIRTGEMGNIQGGNDGDIDGFINAYLTAAANGLSLKQATGKAHFPRLLCRGRFVSRKG